MRIINWLFSKEPGSLARVPTKTNRLDHCLTKAASCQAEGDYENARAACDQVLRTYPNNATAYYIRGLARYALDDLDGALRDWKQSDHLRRQLL